MRKIHSLFVASLVLAALSGAAVSAAISQDPPPPTKTVTISVKDGATGPTGPQGPQGPQGDPGTSGQFTCPTDFDVGDVVINHPGGQVTIYGCIKEG